MTDSIHAALWEWFSACAEITKLFFNFDTAEDSATTITTAGDTLIDDYIDGSQRRQYAFELTYCCPISFALNDPSNIDMLEDAQAIAEWALEQNNIGNLPALPDGMTAEGIAALDEYAGYATMLDENIARYRIPFALTYTITKKG